MDVDEYVEDMKGMLEKFKDYWKAGESRNPGGYPHQIPEAGIWDDEFFDWLGIGR